jgi:hypothetical protein
VTIDESNGLFSVKTVYSLVLSRQELGTFIECRVESPALESVVSNQIHLDLQGELMIIVNGVMVYQLISCFHSASHQNRIVGRETPYGSGNQSFAAMYGECIFGGFTKI